MKTPKSSDSEEITPSKKVLKQARLPFKTISDESPKSVIPPSRKRKLSGPKLEPVTKVGKHAIKNKQEPILVISDDDSNTATEVKKVPVPVNPIVKLVDTAWKKKLHKSKGAKKRKGGVKRAKAVTTQNSSVENNENCDGNESDKVECLEEMDVDGANDTDKQVAEQGDKNKGNSTKVTESSIIDINDNSNSTDNVTNTPLEESNKSTVNSNNSTDNNNDVNKSHAHSPKKSNVEIEQEDIDLKEEENQGTGVAKSPKRSERIKIKDEEKTLDTSVVSNCDESLSSDLSTPRRSNRKISQTNSQGDVSMNDSINVNLTPKQTQKKLESAKKKEDREKERLEREKKKQLEKEEREKQKKEKDEQKKREREEKEEAKKKEREEKEELRKKEKEEKEKQRDLEKKMREEKEEQKRKEKEEKEEQRRKEKEAREDEKRKRQEAIEQEKLEQEQKKKKAAEAFVSFFVPKQKAEKDQVTMTSVSKNDILSSFTIKSDMRLAPTTRVNLNEDSRKTLDNLLLEQNVPKKSLYVKSLRDGLRKPLTNGKTWPLSDRDDDLMIVEDELPPPVSDVSQIITCESLPHEKLHPKLLAFHDNRRPPYWGTWRKKSSCIKPRQPFKTDVKLLDYEVDSDEDWEEEQDGESIDGSAAGSDDEPDADEYEVDNEVFVPHGYLSDEEATMDEDDVLTLSPETQKARLKHLEDEFENEMKKPTEKLKPWFYGLSWETEDGGKPEKCADAIWDYFGKFSMIMNNPTPLLQPSNESVEPDKKKIKKKKADGEQQSPKTDKKKKSKVTDEKDGKKLKVDNKKTNQEVLKNQPGINTFLKKIKI